MLINLYSNALKFTKKDGSVKMNITLVKNDREQIKSIIAGSHITQDFNDSFFDYQDDSSVDGDYP